jgi:flavin-dependent dehydrogenase
MESYDVFIAGGGIGGSVAAKFAAKGGLKTLFVEKCKTPRTKPCSGIQFKYFEKILGERIPRDRLCNVPITRTRMYFPDGSSLGARFSVLNYMRKTFDHWLNGVAQENGAEFRDECEFLDFTETEEGVTATIVSRGRDPEQVRARYAVDATGLRSLPMRRKLRPQDFGETTRGGGMNYYLDGEADLDPNTLYQFWDLRFSDAMFAWIYTKTLDDGKDYWVVGTGCTSDDLLDRQTLFYEYVRSKFNMKGRIVEKEEYLTTIDMKSKDRVWLGKGRILMVGDAAGLMDGVRGVGQDAAALSGRLLAKAVLLSDRKGTSALGEYTELMKCVTKQTRRNQEREIRKFQTNEELQGYLKKGLVVSGLKFLLRSTLNKFRSPEKQRLLPP